MSERVAERTEREENRILLLLGLIALPAAIRLFTASSAAAETEHVEVYEEDAPVIVRGLTLARNGTHLTAESEVLIDAAAELVGDFEPGRVAIGYCEPLGDTPTWSSEDYLHAVTDALGDRAPREFAWADPPKDGDCSHRAGRRPAIVFTPTEF